MVVRHHVVGYDDFRSFIQNFQFNGPVFVLYSGNKLDNGQSWCPDCVQAEPFIEEGLQFAPKEAHFVEVEVGDREYWKDRNCPFRTDHTTKLKVLPTLEKWGTQKRLEGEQLCQLSLIEFLLTDEDD